MESIQPKQIASSTRCSYGTWSRPLAARHDTTHTPRTVSWFAANHARHAARSAGW